MHKPYQANFYRNPGKIFLVVLVGTLTVLLSACGAGEGADLGAQTPPDASPEHPAESAGTLRVELDHLPEGVEAEVSISGPDDATVLVSESHEFTELPAGTYAVEATPADTWFVTGDRSLSVEVKAGETASANFTYDQAFDFSGTVAFSDGNNAHWFGKTEMPVVTLKNENDSHADVDAVEMELEFPNDWDIGGAIPENWDYAWPDEVQLNVEDIPAVPQDETTITATFRTTVAGQDITQQLTLPVHVQAVVYETSDDIDEPGTLRWLLAEEGTVGAEITFAQDTFNAANDTLLLDDEIEMGRDVTITGFEGLTIQPSAAASGDTPDHRLFVIAEETTVQLAELEIMDGHVLGDGSLDYEHGGAIYNKGILTLSDAYFSGNHADFGGAIAVAEEAE